MRKLPRPAGYYDVRGTLLEMVPEACKRVLDVGCGEGNYASYFKEKDAAFVAGVEIDSKAAASARERMDFVWEGPVEDEMPFEPGQFDLILCADVLEHLTDPWEVLKKLRALLAADGYLLASIPNLRYAPVLYNLILKGQFNYRPSGVLDSTHLRFFTRSTMKNLIEESGFEILKWGSSPLPAKYSWWNKLTFGLCRDFFTMQYYILARPLNGLE